MSIMHCHAESQLKFLLLTTGSDLPLSNLIADVCFNLGSPCEIEMKYIVALNDITDFLHCPPGVIIAPPVILVIRSPVVRFDADMYFYCALTPLFVNLA
jgi:hypothetical protein